MLLSPMKKRLKDIANFRVGYLFRGKVKPDPTGSVRVVQIKDVDSKRRINTTGLDQVSIDKPQPYLVQPNDVLFLSRGHRLYATVVPEVAPNTIATGYFFILRPDEHTVSPEYLAWLLNQPSFQESLKPFRRGTHIPMVSRTDVENLRIQIPSLEVQRQIVKLNELLDKERRLVAAIQEKRRLLVQAASRKMMLKPQTQRDD
jgi:restriction endonuclease S subunit